MTRRQRKKAQNGHKTEIEYFKMALALNGKAIEEGPKRKKWSMFDLANINPLTPAQEDTFHAFYNELNLCLHGSAGTGKTFISLYLAISEILQRRIQKNVTIVRSAVPTRDVGFLPGTLEEKLSEFEEPYRNIMEELVGRKSTYDDMKSSGLIRFVSTSYLRGLTWDNTIIIVDEGENMTYHEIYSVMTRVGKNSRVIFAGDTAQTDLNKSKNDLSGMTQAMEVMNNMEQFSDIKFTHNDIVRGDFVKSWIIAAENLAA